MQANPGAPAALAVVAALLGFPPSGLVLMIVVNCALDHAPAVRHRAEVVGQHAIGSAQSKRPIRYRVTVRSWQGSGTETIAVSRDTYLAVERRSVTVLDVHVKPGRLGYPWFEH